MTAKLSFAKIKTMYTLGGYDVSAELSNSSALLALVALTELQSEYAWSDYGDGFEIQDALALALYEVMTNMSATVAPGMILLNMSTANTPNTLYCDGATYNATEYPELYAVLAPSLHYGESQFKTPLLQDRFFRGTNEFGEAGNYGGENEVELLEAHLPATAIVIGGPAILAGGTFGAIRIAPEGGTPHENQPQYCTVRYEITTGQ